jgi:hypothetical protein
MSEWHKIDTAPKDGTRIDVWQYCHDPKWRPDPSAEHGLASGWRLIDVKWADGCWQQWLDQCGDCGFEPIYCSEHHTISHWMPFPEPPK